MTPPAVSSTSAAMTPPADTAPATPEVNPAPAVPAAEPRVTSPAVTPFKLQMSGGYASLNLGNGGPSYSGGIFQTTVGQSFHVHPQHSFFFNGVFRIGGLSDGAGNDISLVHFGLEGGYEAWLAPEILSIFAYAGLGSNILYSEQADVAPEITRALDNQPMFALTLGGGFTLGHGIFVFNGGIQPNFGLEVPPPDGGTASRGFNPVGYFFMGGLDLARLADWAGARFPTEHSLEQFVSGITPGFTLDTTYTMNLGNPADGLNAMRVFDTRADRPMFNYMELSLDREVDEANPFGFRFDFGVGENAGIARARSSFSGEWYDLQQFYGRLRLPVGNGLTLRGGKFATLVGTDVIEGHGNNHISHSWQFGLAEPFTHLGVLADYPINDQVSVSTGIINGWDNVLDRSTGIGWIGQVAVSWNDSFSTSVASMVGDEGGRLRSLVDGIATLTLNDDLARQQDFNRFVLSATYDWGHEGAGAGMPEANWHSFMTTARVNFIPQVGLAQGFEVFGDVDGARTGAPQTMWSTRSTIHVEPLPWIRLRAEFRHDESTEASFLAGELPVTSQNTFALGAGIHY